MLVRHKERKFGKGCVEQWMRQRVQLKRQFGELLDPIDNMLASSPFLLSAQPLFVDHNLFGVIENYLYSGTTSLPNMKHLKRWHHAMSQQ
jgi:glutathione S-transferase